jgi:hypothetical protein
LGLRIGLTFEPVVKGRKRVIRKLARGCMVFADGRLPVPLFGKDNVHDRQIGDGTSVEPATGQKEEVAVTGTACVPVQETDGDECLLIDGQPEGISFTKVSRGERI